MRSGLVQEVVLMENNLCDTSEERNLLASCLKSQEAWLRVSDSVTSDYFSDSLNRNLWEIVSEIRNRGVNPSPVVIFDKLPKDLQDQLTDIGGWKAIDALVELPIDPSGVEYHAKKLYDYTVLRRGKVAGEKIQNLADNSATSETFLQKVDEIVNDIPGEIGTEVTFLGSIAEDYVTKRRNHPQEIPGISTGFAHLDSIIQGLQPGRLYTLGARTGVGKSIWCLNLVKNLAIDQMIPVLYISTEQTQQDEISRLLSVVAQVREHYLNNGTFINMPDQAAKIDNAIAQVKNSPIHFSHDPRFQPDRIYRLIKKYVLTEGVKAVFFDYIRVPVKQLGSNDKWAVVGDFAYGLKAIASELEIPIVTAAQINRAGAAAFRDTGEIEDDQFAISDEIVRASSVAMALRPLNKKEKEDYQDNIERRILAFAKNRHGSRSDKILYSLNDGFVRLEELKRIAPD